MRGQHVTGCYPLLPRPSGCTANLMLHSFPQLFRCFFHSSQLHWTPQTLMQGFCPFDGAFHLCNVANTSSQGAFGWSWTLQDSEQNCANLQKCYCLFLVSRAHGSWRIVNNIKWERSIFWDGWDIWLQFGQTPHGPFSFLGFTKALFDRGAVWNLLDIWPFSTIYTEIWMYRTKYFISQ